jgi:hypothetical protein
MAPLPGPIGSFTIESSAIGVEPSYFFPPAESATPIGEFATGVSPIGPVKPFNWQSTVISQYANSQRLLQLIENFNAYIDPNANIDAFYRQMWSIDTAVGYGLDVWGRILGIGRTLPVDSGSYLGFAEPNDVTEVGFNQEGFYSGPPVTSNYRLSDDAYRQLLLAKAAFNICDGSIPAINQLLMTLFAGRGNAYVLEGDGVDRDYFGFAETGDPFSQGFNVEPFYSGQDFSDMNMRYVFKFLLTPVELSIVNNSGVLPTPSGVNAVIEISP